MKKTISVKEFMADLKNRVPDEELKKKYGLSENGLKRLFDESLAAMARGSLHIRIEFEE